MTAIRCSTFVLTGNPRDLRSNHAETEQIWDFTSLVRVYILSTEAQSFKEFRAAGEVAEWPIAPVLKTGVPRGTGGSNPPLSVFKRMVAANTWNIVFCSDHFLLMPSTMSKLCLSGFSRWMSEWQGIFARLCFPFIEMIHQAIDVWV